MLKTQNQIFEEAMLNGDVSKLPQTRWDPSAPQQNQSAIRSRNAEKLADEELSLQMRRASGENVVIEDGKFMLAGRQMRIKPVKDLSEYL